MSAVLNGSSQYFRGDALFFSPSYLTLFAAWVKPSNTTAYGGILEVSNDNHDGAHDGLELYLAGPEANTRISAVSVRDGVYRSSNSATDYASGVWQPVFGLFTSTTSRSSSVGAGNFGTPETTSNNPTNGAHTYIGCRFTSSASLFFPGRIAEAAVWNNIADNTAAMAIVTAFAAGNRATAIAPDKLVLYKELLSALAGGSDTGGGTWSATGSPTFDDADHPTILSDGSNSFNRASRRRLLEVGRTGFTFGM